MSTNTSSRPTAEEQLQSWQRLEKELGVRGPDGILEMVRSLEAQLVALYADLDAGETK